MNAGELTVRRAEPQDCAAIAFLSGKLGYPTKKSNIEKQLTVLTEDKGHVIFVALINVYDIVGWIHLMPRQLLYMSHLTEIGGLVVHEDHHRKGVAQALIQTAELWAKEQGYSSIVVCSNIARNASHAFYRRVGFRDMKTQNVYIKELNGEHLNSPYPKIHASD